MLDHIGAREFARAGIDADAILADRGRVRSRSYARRLVGILMALGYPESWQAAMIGFEPIVPGRQIRLDCVEMLLRLLAHVGDAWAAPENTGCTAEEIMETQVEASRHYCYPPAAYDEMFDVIPIARVPLRRRLHAYRSGMPGGADPVRNLQILMLRINDHLTSKEIAAQMRVHTRTVERAVAATGLRCTASAGVGRVTTPDPGQDELIAKIRDAHQVVQTRPEAAWDVWQQLDRRPTARRVTAAHLGYASAA